MSTRMVVVIFGALLMAGGCSSKLATGYEPRKLGASESVRRTYYAPPYSPDSHPQGPGQGDGPPPSPGG